MGILARVTAEPRTIETVRVPYRVQTLAGTPITPDTAVTLATVWAALRYLTQTVAVLPWHVMKDGPKGAEVRSSHPVDYLLWKRASNEWSSFQFRETLLHWALRWGNGYAEIERDQLGRPFALWPIHPSRVEVCRDPETGRLYYEIDQEIGAKVNLEPADVFHLRGFGEGVVGVNVMAYAAESLGWARAAQLFGASFFGNGLNVSGIVMNKKPLKEAGLARQRSEMDRLYKGPRNAHKVAILDNDAEWKSISTDPRNAQLIELNQHLVEEVCRWMGVPPHKVMHLLRATFSNIESQAIEVVVDSVSPWVKRFEDEADFKLFGQNRERFYSKMNMRALMRGDAKSRAEYYKAMREMGAYNANRIRELEDENTIGPDGDKYIVNSTYTTLDRVGEVEPAASDADPSQDDADADVEASLNRLAALMGHAHAE